MSVCLSVLLKYFPPVWLRFGKTWPEIERALEKTAPVVNTLPQQVLSCDQKLTSALVFINPMLLIFKLCSSGGLRLRPSFLRSHLAAFSSLKPPLFSGDGRHNYRAGAQTHRCKPAQTHTCAHAIMTNLACYSL